MAKLLIEYVKEIYINRNYRIFTGLILESEADQGDLKPLNMMTFSGSLLFDGSLYGKLLYVEIDPDQVSSKKEYFVKRVFPVDFQIFESWSKKHWSQVKRLSSSAIFDISSPDRNLNSRTYKGMLTDAESWHSKFPLGKRQAEEFLREFVLPNFVLDLTSGTGSYLKVLSFVSEKVSGGVVELPNLYNFSLMFDLDPQRVDRIVDSLDLDVDEDTRELAYLAYNIVCFCWKENLVYVTYPELSTLFVEQDMSTILERLKKLHRKGFGRLYEDKKVFIPNSLYIVECGIANRLLELARKDVLSSDTVLDSLGIVQRVSHSLGFPLSAAQEEALRLVHSNAVTVVTGKAGTGKSTFAKVLREYFISIGRSYKFLSTTGRAAQVLAIKTEMKSSQVTTIHSFLNFDGKNFSTPDEQYDYIVVDETSMCDSYLAYNLLTKVSKHTRFVFLGDHRQLPPVGAGNFFYSMLSYDLIPKCELTTVYRQGPSSLVLEQANRVCSGLGFEASNSGDFRVNLNTATEAVAAFLDKFIRHMAENSIPSMVMTPFKKGSLGVESINQFAQRRVNPLFQKSATFSNRVYQFFENDRVIFTQNNWQEGRTFCNGDLGTVVKIVEGKGGYVVVRDDTARDIKLTWYEAKTVLDLAYCMTIHKAQGSEFKYVCLIIPEEKSYGEYLTQNLLYTAFTRSSSKLIVFCTTDFLENSKNLKTIDNFRSNRSLLPWLFGELGGKQDVGSV